MYSRSEVYNSARMVPDAVNSVPKFSIPDFPFDDPEKLTGLEDPGAKRSVDRGCVGALGGFVLHQKNPGGAIENPKRYHCDRKNKFGILLSALCGAHRKFTWYDISSSPSTHDHSAFQNTEFGHKIYAGLLGQKNMYLGQT